MVSFSMSSPDAVRMPSNSTKKPRSWTCDGHESQQQSEGPATPRHAEIAPPCANLIIAPSEALPRVFQRISVTVEPSPWTLTLLKGNSTLLPVTSSSKYLSKLQVLHKVEHFTNALKPAESVSNVLIPFVKLLPAS